MLDAFRSSLPILDLHNMHDQLILGAHTDDKAFLHQVLNNPQNVLNFIQLSPNSAINLLFKCLEVLNDDENNQPLISNILCLVYSHCSARLSQQAKAFILNYTGMNTEELSNPTPTQNIGVYFSAGAKRQRLEPSQSKENEIDRSEPQSGFRKKHLSDSIEITSLAKRQRCQSPASSHKRGAPLQSTQSVEQASKRKR